MGLLTAGGGWKGREEKRRDPTGGGGGERRRWGVIKRRGSTYIGTSRKHRPDSFLDGVGGRKEGRKGGRKGNCFEMFRRYVSASDPFPCLLLLCAAFFDLLQYIGT